MFHPRTVSQCLEIVVVKLDVQQIGQTRSTALRLLTVEEREDLVDYFPPGERWTFFSTGCLSKMHRVSS